MSPCLDIVPSMSIKNERSGELEFRRRETMRKAVLHKTYRAQRPPRRCKAGNLCEVPASKRRTRHQKVVALVATKGEGKERLTSMGKMVWRGRGGSVMPVLVVMAKAIRKESPVQVDAAR